MRKVNNKIPKKEKKIMLNCEKLAQLSILRLSFSTANRLQKVLLEKKKHIKKGFSNVFYLIFCIYFCVMHGSLSLIYYEIYFLH